MENTNKYILTYIVDSSSSCFIQLLSFSNFDLNDIIIKSVEESQIISSSKVINCFQANDIIILFYKYNNYYMLNIYDLNLNLTSRAIELDYISSTGDVWF